MKIGYCPDTPRAGQRSTRVVFKGEEKASPRKEFVYWNDDGQLCGIRLMNIKLNFLVQHHKGIDVWRRGFESLRIPLAFNLRNDPFERSDESGSQFQTANQLYFIVPGQAVVTKWVSTFKEFPPRQKPSSFNVDHVLEKLINAAAHGPGR